MRGIAAYKSSNVQSAPPQRIIVMLYQAAVMRMYKGLDALEAGEFKEFRGYSRHVRDILTELRAALNPDVAPELCANLDRLYGWGIVELGSVERDADGDFEANAERIRGVTRVLEELLAGWEDVARNLHEAA